MAIRWKISGTNCRWNGITLMNDGPPTTLWQTNIAGEIFNCSARKSWELSVAGYEGLVFHCHIFPCSLGLISLLTTLQIMIQATFTTIKFAKNRSKSQELPRNCRFSRPLVHLRARFPHFSPKSPIPPQPSARANSPRPVPPSSAAAGRWPRWRWWPRGLKETPTSSCCPGHWVAPASGGVWRCCLDTLILENSNRNSWLSSEIHLGDMGSIENLG